MNHVLCLSTLLVVLATSCLAQDETTTTPIALQTLNVKGKIYQGEDLAHLRQMVGTNYIRTYTIPLDHLEESCYFIDVTEQNVLDFTYMVLDADPNDAHRYSVSVRLLQDNVVFYESGQVTANLAGYVLHTAHPIQICIANTVSPSKEQKHIYWDVSISGKVDEIEADRYDVSKRAIAEEEYFTKTDMMEESLAAMRFNVMKGVRLLWQSKANAVKDLMYVLAVKHMIDYWSVAHILLVMVVCVCQVFVLKRLFNVSTTSSSTRGYFTKA